MAKITHGEDKDEETKVHFKNSINKIPPIPRRLLECETMPLIPFDCRFSGELRTRKAEFILCLSGLRKREVKKRMAIYVISLL